MTPRAEHADPRIADAVARVRRAATAEPTVGVVLGSGLGPFADALDGCVRVPYSDVPGMPVPSVEGHAGALCLGRCGGVAVACLSGRVHLYEGRSPDDVVFGARLLAGLGCRTVLLTNAAGGIRGGMTPGSLMLVTDHLNLTGRNPLVGRAAFVDLGEAYDRAIAEAARAAARAAGLSLHEGVYAGLIGPSYETPAEIRMLRALGADAVGMSTVLEVIALRELGVRVGVLSCITNAAAGSGGALSHDDVQATAARVRGDIEALLGRWIPACAAVEAG